MVYINIVIVVKLKLCLKFSVGLSALIQPSLPGSHFVCSILPWFGEFYFPLFKPFPNLVAAAPRPPSTPTK